MVAYGRRLGWYAVVRAIKPKVVMETGVDQGLGSCILAEALRKNDAGGKKGRYFGTDILPEAGQLFTGEYKNYGEILYGDSLETLKNFKRKIDVFINDSDHNPKYEAKEYQIISKLLKKSSIVMGDNSHGSPELCKFAERTNRKFTFFKERPEDHWYYGAGIGFAYDRQ
jgi:predicted O-methyltransferase YrrM